MPNPGDDLEARVTRAENDIRNLRTEVDEGRVLASGADREVSAMRIELRAHTKVLNALRETQIEQGHKHDELRSEMQRGFGMLQTGMAQIVAMLTNNEREEGRPG